MNKIAVFPGSFDPFTIGHQELVKQALPLFKKIIIAVGQNSQKDDYLFPITKRISWIKSIYNDNQKIEVDAYKGLTANFCELKNANFIIRGLRDSDDFKFEKNIAQMNNKINNNIETIFFITPPEVSHISSSVIRDIIKNGGDASKFIPKEMKLK